MAARQFFVGGNFKMNPTSWKATAALIDGLLAADIDPKTEVVVATPALYLISATEYIKSKSTASSPKITLSAQNVYAQEKGAFTGEISPHMLKDAGVPWTLVGHSERRTLFNDTNKLVADKTKLALSEGIKVILCIGETLQERESNETFNVCKASLDAVVAAIEEKDWANVVIAYEPVWSIGTGKVASPAQAQEVHDQLRAYLASNVSQKVSDETRIIYGGSVSASNCKDLSTQKDIDGFLVGGASLKPEFADICNARNVANSLSTSSFAGPSIFKSGERIEVSLIQGQVGRHWRKRRRDHGWFPLTINNIVALTTDHRQSISAGSSTVYPRLDVSFSHSPSTPQPAFASASPSPLSSPTFARSTDDKSEYPIKLMTESSSVRGLSHGPNWMERAPTQDIKKAQPPPADPDQEGSPRVDAQVATAAKTNATVNSAANTTYHLPQIPTINSPTRPSQVSYPVGSSLSFKRLSRSSMIYATPPSPSVSNQEPFSGLALGPPPVALPPVPFPNPRSQIRESIGSFQTSSSGIVPSAQNSRSSITSSSSFPNSHLGSMSGVEPSFSLPPSSSNTSISGSNTSLSSSPAISRQTTSTAMAAGDNVSFNQSFALPTALLSNTTPTERSPRSRTFDQFLLSPSSFGVNPAAATRWAGGGTGTRAQGPPLALVVNQDTDQEDGYKCPVCVERIGAEFRISGERPDVIPECGHSIHHDCFVHVYGPLPEVNRFGDVRKVQSYGVCGVCRKPMRVSEDGGSSGGASGKPNKLAALTGAKSMNGPPPPLLNPLHKPKLSVYGEYENNDGDSEGDDNDPLDTVRSGALSVKSGQSDHVRYEGSSAAQIVVPSITILPEFQSAVRVNTGKLIVTAVVIVEVPLRSRREETELLSSSISMTGLSMTNGGGNIDVGRTRSGTGKSLSSFGSTSSGRNSSESTLARSPSSSSHVSSFAPMSLSSSGQITTDTNYPSPEFLRRKLVSMDGQVGLIDNLSTLLACNRAVVRSNLPSLASSSGSGSGVKEKGYLLYLFKEALLLVQEPSPSESTFLKVKASSLFKRMPTVPSFGRGGAGAGSLDEVGSAGTYRLRQKILVRRMRGVRLSRPVGLGPSGSDTSMTIVVEDNRRLSDLVLMFPNQETRRTWWDRITHLIPTIYQDGTFTSGPNPESKKKPDTHSLSNLSRNDSRSGSVSKFTNLSSLSTTHRHSPTLSTSSSNGSNFLSVTSSVRPMSVSGLSIYHSNPKTHTPIDILLIVSLTSPSIANASTALRTRIIRSSLAFVMDKIGSKDRLALVTYENGPQGVIRRTPFLAVGRDGPGRRRLSQMLDRLGEESKEADPFLVPLHREEKSDVVSAVNVALDVVMQRKTKNPLTGIALVCDSVDSVNRSQMDLVLARAEAADVPIHSIGYGKSHDPSPLQLISNHTHGTYIFVDDWYDLQISLAGVIGGLMSIALTRMKLHISTAENDFSVRKVFGVDSHIPPDGKHVDIELRELCHGERREFLVELELDDSFEHGGGKDERGRPKSSGSIGGKGASRLSSSAYTSSAMIDEVPVLELDCSFYDPYCSKACSRLAHPLLLLITLLPSTETHHSPLSEPIISRRRMELMASDTIDRALLFVSRRNYKRAQRLMQETRMIIRSVAEGLIDQIDNISRGEYLSAKKERRDGLARECLVVLRAILMDVDSMLEGLVEESVSLFDRDQRNLGAQQAMILRSQKAWTPRTETERLYFTAETALELVQQSSSSNRSTVD
ncbi:Triosephosphate isomerase [Phaffia rhodozyma]|uniref:Triosephosphate isomerase n=1 Tax=Phaffia rhodozyma TaxID=264483 RepID=A0A0F7SU72_PHARH|nr:Triosephosphate isomerase [Phaffia rhodozyma]